MEGPPLPLLAKKAVVSDTAEFSHKAPLETTTQKGFVNAGVTELSRDGSAKIDCLVSEEDLLRAKSLSEKLVATLLSSKGLQVKNTVSVLDFLH